MFNLGALVDRIGREVCFSRWVFFFIEKVLFKNSLELKILEGIKKNEDPSKATNPFSPMHTIMVFQLQSDDGRGFVSLLAGKLDKRIHKRAIGEITGQGESGPR